MVFLRLPVVCFALLFSGFTFLSMVLIAESSPSQSPVPLLFEEDTDSVGMKIFEDDFVEVREYSPEFLGALDSQHPFSLMVNGESEKSELWSFVPSPSNASKIPVLVDDGSMGGSAFFIDSPKSWVGSSAGKNTSGVLVKIGNQVYGRFEEETKYYTLMPISGEKGLGYFSTFENESVQVECFNEPLAEPVQLDLSKPEVQSAYAEVFAEKVAVFEPFPVRYRVTVAYDVASNFLEAFNGDTEQAAEYLLAVTEGVNTVYERDVFTSLQVVYIRFRQPGNDPYLGYSTRNDILGRFIQVLRDERVAGTLPAEMVEADLLHIIYGANDGGVAGGANVCGEFPEYRIGCTSMPGLDQDLPKLDITGEMVTLAHEFGHQFSAPHTHCYNPPVHRCFSSECYAGPRRIEDGDTMAYCPVHHIHFHPVSRYQITNWLAERSCIKPFEIDRFEPDDVSIPVLSPQRIQWKTISSVDNEDWASFELTKSSTVRIRVNFSQPVNAEVVVLNQSGNVVATAISDAEEGNTIELFKDCNAPLNPGSYRIKIHAIEDPENVISYSLRLTQAACDGSDYDAFEPDNQQNEARLLAAGDVEFHTLTPDDEDWYILDISPEQKDRRISITATKGLIYGFLMNEVQQPLQRIENSTDEDFHYSCHDQLLLPGRYFIRLLTRSGSSVEYQVAFSEKPCECVTTVTPKTFTVSAAGGNFQTDVSTSGSCFWNAWTSHKWISALNVDKINQRVTFTVLPNYGISRSGVLMVAGKAVTIQQLESDPHEPNNSHTQATPLVAGSILTHSLWPNEDPDFFQFTLNTSARAVVTSVIALGSVQIARVNPTPIDFGNALELSGDGSHVQVPSGNWFGNAFSIECWVKPTEHSIWARVMDFSNGAGNNNVLFASSTWNTGRPRFEVYSNQFIGLEYPDSIPLKQWSHLAATYDGTTYKVYLNGTLVNQLVSSIKPQSITRNQCYIGRSPFTGDEPFTGSLDQFRLWSRALTESEIKSSMISPVPPSTVGLQLNYTFNSLEDLGAGTTSGMNDFRETTGNFHAELLGSGSLNSHSEYQVLAESSEISANLCIAAPGGSISTECNAEAEALDLGCLSAGSYLLRLSQRNNDRPFWQGESRTILRTFPCNQPSVTVLPTSLTLERNPVLDYLYVVTPTGQNWSVTNIPTWLTVEPTTGVGSSVIKITAEGNWSTQTNSGDTRTATLTVGSTAVTVTQLDDTCSKTSTVVPSSLTLPAEGGSGSAFWRHQQDNCREWGPTLSSSESWLEVASGTSYRDAIRLFAKPNMTTSSRTAMVRDWENLTLLTVTQPGAMCTVLNDVITYNVNAKPFQTTINALTNGTCSWEERSLIPWVNLPPQDRYQGTQSVPLTVTANPSLTPRTTNPYENAINFDGVNDYASVPAGVWFNGPFTIESRVFLRSYNNWSRISDFGVNANSNNVILAATGGTNGYPVLDVWGNGTLLWGLGSYRQIPLNRWTHVAATFDGSTAKIYLDGVLSGELNNITTLPPSIQRTRCYLGRSNWSSDDYLNGILDEYRLWNRALLQDELLTNMTRLSPVSTSGLQLYYKMNEATGTQLNNEVSTSNKATLSGGALRTPAQRGVVVVGNREIIINQTGAEWDQLWMIF